MKIKISIKVTERDIEDILITAFEGGIDYWCDYITNLKGEAIHPINAIAFIKEGIPVRLHEIEDDEPDNTHLLSLKLIKKGLKKFVKHHPSVLDGRELDTGNIDAEYADQIIQLSIFKKLVFG